mmetsp:Transcript_56849/g.161338  ORF Transcript_56849/g.161338 Transcript_56849/m.161338 type:complete len:225 (-) Transcript_56849:663-1337(-)
MAAPWIFLHAALYVHAGASRRCAPGLFWRLPSGRPCILPRSYLREQLAPLAVTRDAALVACALQLHVAQAGPVGAGRELGPVGLAAPPVVPVRAHEHLAHQLGGQRLEVPRVLRRLHGLRVPGDELEAGPPEALLAEPVGNLEDPQHVARGHASLQPASAEVLQVRHFVLVRGPHQASKHLRCILHVPYARREVCGVEEVEEQRDRCRVQVIDDNAAGGLLHHV